MQSNQAAGRGSLEVTLNDLSRRFGRRVVFQGVSASVGAGGALVVTGPNGSGKSTLVKIVAGLLRASGGTVTISAGGHRIEGSDRGQVLGYVAPDLALYAELSGVENLLFFGRLRGIRLERADLVDLLERVGLRGRGRDLVGNYSSGMRQRLKYAFALLHRPPILLLDEPTANLDAQGAAIVEDVVREQRVRGLAIIATNERRELDWGDEIVRLGGAA